MGFTWNECIRSHKIKCTYASLSVVWIIRFQLHLAEIKQVFRRCMHDNPAMCIPYQKELLLREHLKPNSQTPLDIGQFSSFFKYILPQFFVLELSSRKSYKLDIGFLLFQKFRSVLSVPEDTHNILKYTNKFISTILYPLVSVARARRREKWH